ncbi:unnamed protein product [marine sediment metagenome]|uniref:Oligopeptide transport permease C-like N-terminal domain-containing protein n=1 Tax=marine sediment metagenome TaxID=412755 RepID=X1T5U1_9ZZZZ
MIRRRPTKRNGRASPRIEQLRRRWYKFSSNPLSFLGLVVVALLILVALFARMIAPFPCGNSAGP